MNKINYNLQKISKIDEQLVLNGKNKEAYINKYSYIFLLSKILKILSNKLLLFIFIVIVTIISNSTPFITIIYDSIFVIIYNSIIFIMGYIFKIPDDYYTNINMYSKNRELLLNKRNLYVNLYNYSKNKEKLVLNNIRLRINNKYFLDYHKYKNQKWLKEDIYAYATLKEMYYKEIIYTNIIRNRIELELISPNYSEEIPKDKLKSILNIL